MADTPNTPTIYMVQSSSNQTKPSIIKETPYDIEFRACLQTGDVLNRNSKIYPSEQIHLASQQEAFQDQIRRRCLFGEFNHPMSPSLDRQLYLDTKRMSHSILTFERKNKDFYGNILTTRAGQGSDLMGVIQQGSVVGFSLRGLHKLVKNPNNPTQFIVKDLRIFTYDVVTFPSHKTSTMVAATESAAVVPKETIDAVLASENAGTFGMYQDLLNDDISDVRISQESLTFAVCDSVVAIKASKTRTLDILKSLI